MDFSPFTLSCEILLIFFLAAASSLQDDVVSDGVSETKLCVSSNPSSLSSCVIPLVDNIIG